MTTILISALLALTGSAESTNIMSYVQSDFKDATFTARVQSGNQKELAKINKDFGLSYRFSYSNISVKEPFCFRAESTVEDSKLTVIQNGMTQKFNTPIYHATQNLSKSPGRVRSMLEFGILTPALFDDYFDSKFIRFDRSTGDAVFDITYVTRLDDTSRFRVWVDPSKKYTTKREWYGQGRGILKATFFYDQPKDIDGIWVPTHSYVKNSDNVVAGALTYDGLKVNRGLSDSLFKIK